MNIQNHKEMRKSKLKKTKKSKLNEKNKGTNERTKKIKQRLNSQVTVFSDTPSEVRKTRFGVAQRARRQRDEKASFDSLELRIEGVELLHSRLLPLSQGVKGVTCSSGNYAGD
jgi:hypothetical protein